MVSNFLPFSLSPLGLEWRRPSRSAFARTLGVAIELMNTSPELLRLVGKDLREAALSKKEARRSEARAKHRQAGCLPGTDGFHVMPHDEVPCLETGRPGMEPETCFIFLIVRGYLGSIKSREARDFISESVTLWRFLAQRQLNPPSFSSILENTNKITQATLDAIFAAQLRMIKDHGMDSFEQITCDSTACQANSCWPTDSHLILFLAERLSRFFGNLTKYECNNMVSPCQPEALHALHSLNFEIAMTLGKKDGVKARKIAYQQFLDEAEVLNQVFEENISRIRLESQRPHLKPSLKKKLAKKIVEAERDLSLMTRMITNATLRVIEEEEVPSQDKLASVTDFDAAFISKGQRETVVGYRPQISKSGRGFVTGLIVPEGNAADAGQAIPLYVQTVARTGVTPDVISLDDGYTSAKNLADLHGEGVRVVSFSGSKGKKVTPAEAWVSEPYSNARRMRSAVESVIYQLKQGFGFGRMTRRGISKVRQELTSKVLAFNFFRVQYLLG